MKTQRVGELHLATCVNLDHQGPAEIVLSLGIGLDRPPAESDSRPPQSNRLWLVVLSGRDGSVNWKQPLSEPFLAGDNDGRVTPAIADLDGDGVDDIMAGALTATNSWDACAFSGVNGQVLWRQPLSRERNVPVDRLLRLRPEPLVGDLDGDGLSEIVVVDHAPLEQAGPNGELMDCTMLVLDGRTGQPKWKWTWSERSDDRRVLPLLINFRGGHERDVCLLTGQFDRSEIVLLDARGQVVERLRVNLRQWPGRLWQGDLLGDGREELLYLTNDGQLQAVRGGLRQVLWRQPADQVHGIYSLGGEAATVVVQRGRDMVGLSGATNSALWRSEFASSQSGAPVLLASAQRDELPLVVAADPSGVVCRQVLPTLASGEYRPPAGGRPVPLPVARDPRLVRALPWDLLGETGTIPGQRLRTFGRGALLEGGVLAVILALPTMLVWWIWRKWSWKAGTAATILAGDTDGPVPAFDNGQLAAVGVECDATSATGAAAAAVSRRWLGRGGKSQLAAIGVIAGGRGGLDPVAGRCLVAARLEEQAAG